MYSSSPEEEEDLNNLAEEAEDQFIQISISEPHKVGDGAISSYMAYKVNTRTNMKLFRRQSFSVTRRFSDFLGKFTFYWIYTKEVIYDNICNICAVPNFN